MVGDTIEDDVEGATAVGMRRGAGRPRGPLPGEHDSIADLPRATDAVI